MTTNTQGSALDGYNIDFETTEPSNHVITTPKPDKIKNRTNYLSMYFAYIVEVILK